jgi:DNA-binding MarR family transcriptional regulator
MGKYSILTLYATAGILGIQALLNGYAKMTALTMTRNHETDQLRLLAKIARMYHERGIRQPQIAADLHISQSRVSRLLQQASSSASYE